MTAPSRAAAAAVALAVCLAAAPSCDRHAAERLPVHLALAESAAVSIDGRIMPHERRMIDDRPALVLEPGRAQSFFVALPSAAVLRFSSSDAPVPDQLHVEIAGDDDAGSVSVRAIGSGQFEADLSRTEPGPVEIRFESIADVLVTLLDPRIEGLTVSKRAPIAAAKMPDRSPYNVIVYVVDTLRADRLSVYGYERPTSPELERLARRGLLFENAYAPGSHTMPSISALFGSRMPSELQGRLTPDGPAETTLAESFHRAGYRTAAFQTNFVVLDSLGFARGFDTYDQLRHEHDGQLELYDAAELHAEIEAWLRQKPAEPFFLYVQSMDVHFPYDAPAPYGRMFLRDEHVALPDNEFVHGLNNEKRREVQAFADAWNPDLYDGGVAYADHYLGVLVDLIGELGLTDRTIVVVTSDHGEPLGDRGEFRHGYSLHEELVRVPLLMLLPGITSGERIGAVVSLMDLAPTLLDLTRQPIPASFAGTSMLATGSQATPRTAAGEQLMIPDQRTEGWYLRRGRWKLILDRDGHRALYDVEADPRETRDLASEHPAIVGLLTSALIERSAALRGEVVAEPLVGDQDYSDLERALRTLGYVE